MPVYEMSCIWNVVRVLNLECKSQCRFHLDMLQQLPENIRLGWMGLAVSKAMTAVKNYCCKDTIFTTLDFLCNLRMGPIS